MALYNDKKSGYAYIAIYNEHLMSVVKALEHSQIPIISATTELSGVTEKLKEILESALRAIRQ